MRVVSNATCTLVDPVSVLLAPCFETISCLASFVRLMRLLCLVSPSNPPEAGGKPRLRHEQGSNPTSDCLCRRWAYPAAAFASECLLQEKPADAPPRDRETDHAEDGQVHEVDALVP